MALSNITRESRREITETLVGIAVIGGFLFGDYLFAIWFQEVAGTHSCGNHQECYESPWPLGMAVGLLALLAIMVLALVVHVIGEGICDALERHGIHLRPKQRH